MAIAAELNGAREGATLIVAQSNAGLPQLHEGEFRYEVDPDHMAEHARELRALGVDVIGACCGSSPEHIGVMTAAPARRSVGQAWTRSRSAAVSPASPVCRTVSGSPRASAAASAAARSSGSSFWVSHTTDR